MQQPPNPEQPYAQQPTQPPYYQPTQQPYNGQQTPVPPPSYQYNNYPSQQPPMQSKKSRTWMWIIGLILAFLVGRASVTTASSTADAPQTSTANTTTNQQAATQPTQAPSTAHHKIGETVSVDNTWDITVDSVTTSQGDTIDVPKAGNTFLLITMTFKNISSQQQAVSSLLGLTLRGPDGTNYEQALYTGGQGVPDGDVASGAMTKGVTSYEVPKSIHSFTLNYSDLGGQVQTWDISD